MACPRPQSSLSSAELGSLELDKGRQEGTPKVLERKALGVLVWQCHVLTSYMDIKV